MLLSCAKRFRLLGKLNLVDPLNNLSILADQAALYIGPYLLGQICRNSYEGHLPGILLCCVLSILTFCLPVIKIYNRIDDMSIAFMRILQFINTILGQGPLSC